MSAQSNSVFSKNRSVLGNPENYPDAAVVCAALHEWSLGFPSQEAAAKKLGVAAQTLSDYRHGKRRMPEWLCEFLGYRRVYVYIGTVGVRPA